MRRTTILALLLAIALGLGVAACGGGDGEAGATDALTDTGSLFPTDTGLDEEPPAPPPAETGEAVEPIQITVPKPGEVIGPSSPAARVAELQDALIALGYKIGEPDGIYGGKTRKAVVKFQKKFKLEADGLVGAKTAKKMNKELAKLGSG
jgi:peptidoglycan hydrolase-like protein with peptidoglycan-binding domain